MVRHGVVWCNVVWCSVRWRGTVVSEYNNYYYNYNYYYYYYLKRNDFLIKNLKQKNKIIN